MGHLGLDWKIGSWKGGKVEPGGTLLWVKKIGKVERGGSWLWVEKARKSLKYI